MEPLEKSLRNQLEKTVKEARDVAEAAARAALEQLGVGEAAPYSHLGDPERELRRKLRAHGRQLGDIRNSRTEMQEIDRLIEEVAYEHWHRMLFARFLAENNLLMYPDPDDPVAVTLEECEDLAADEGAKNGWELASRFAARMLPQIFRPDSPVFQLELPPEHQQKLERLVAELPVEVFIASDSLGWVYQFWQTKKKDEINASEVKIGARELPAVTQLFTEPYMVSFLLDNSLGAWWVSRRLTESDLRNAQSEEELRQKAALPGVPLKYLRFVRTEDGRWTPAGGTFDNWPEHLRELKTLDPCCGSGHFLVAAFLMLVSMRMELEGFSARESVDAVLRENLHGLEIDQRCVELAAFALAITAWRYPGAGGYRNLPELHLACSGLSVSVAKEEWKQLALDKHNLRIALDWIYDVFKDAPVLGSLLNPAKTDAAKIVPWDELSESISKGLEKQNGDEERHEASVVAHGLAKAATLLSRKYHWVITNVPYLKRGKQGEVLRSYCERYYPAAKNDVATVFLDRCLELCEGGKASKPIESATGHHHTGTVSIVLPQNWLFLSSYKKFREKLLKRDTWHLIARLGPGAFETISGEVVKAILITLSRGGKMENPSSNIVGLDVTRFRTASEKSAQLILTETMRVEQLKQLNNPDARVTFDDSQGELLEKYAIALNGMHGADSPRFRFNFWELRTHREWRFLQNTVESTSNFAGRSQCFFWPNNGAIHINNPQARIQGEFGWGKLGIAVSMMNNLPCTLYSGDAFDISCSPVIPHNPTHLPAIWCFCSSPEYNDAVRQIDQSLKVTNATLVKVPFDLDYWTKVAQAKYPEGLPKPCSDDPTQWIFHGHPAQSDEALQVAIARLLGYRWPAELDANMELSIQALARITKSETLLPFADTDGIVCIPPVRGEASATDRLLNLLAAAYDKSWSNDKLSELLKHADHAGKTLENWLRDKYFTQHCKLFDHRPFIWHIWDGLRDGFAALVNYHKLDRKNLETLIYTYLGDWISRQKQDISDGVDGAEEKVSAAENLKKRLEMILEGEAPYDIFVRWKPIEKQPIGWDPDLNDGVRINIRPFLSVPDIGKRGAGVLRDKPNINWNKDRGKDVPSSPWYHLFNGDRINDHHLTLAEKRAVREIDHAK
jgi:hypothetical protein